MIVGDLLLDNIFTYFSINIETHEIKRIIDSLNRLPK